jgi:DNA-binding response OmpR family regulator
VSHIDKEKQRLVARVKRIRGQVDSIERSLTAKVSMLLSRLHAHLRRRERDLGLPAKTERRVAIGRFTLDRRARVLLADEMPIILAHREMKLLEQLASSPSRVFSSDEILDEVWEIISAGP